MSDSKWFFTIFVSIVIIGLSLMYGIPKYNVWRSEIAITTAQNNGKAEMAEAEENRKIAVLEAQANLEVETLNGKAEVERATYMAMSIEIEDGKLTDRYLKYLWVRNIQKMDGDKIYIPTEANLPILEVK